MKRFSVVALHFTTDCNLKCPMCYKSQKNGQKNFEFFKKTVPYLAEITEQVAVGGGEPFLYPEFVRDFSKECKEYGLICNATTNGTLLKNTLESCKDLEMVSVSFDRFKVLDINKYLNTVEKLGERVRVGANMLIDNEMFKNPFVFLKLADILFTKVERVFALYPKNWEPVPILKHERLYAVLSSKYEHFYVDDLTNMILSQKKYGGWNKPCHYGKDIISLNENGIVTGCSFSQEPLIELHNPREILDIVSLDIEERYSCPYLLEKCIGG